MTLLELRDLCDELINDPDSGLDKDSQVLLSSDSEGNRYRPADGYDAAVVDKRDYDLISNESTGEWFEPTDEGIPADAMPCVIFYPS